MKKVYLYKDVDILLKHVIEQWSYARTWGKDFTSGSHPKTLGLK